MRFPWDFGAAGGGRGRLRGKRSRICGSPGLHQSPALNLGGMGPLFRGLGFRGPQMGGQIRRGRICRFWGAPIFSPEVPKYLFLK